MALNERIDKVKNYFINFNAVAAEDAYYALMRFPHEWTLPDVNALKDTYKVEIATRQEGVYFLTEMSNDINSLFDCIDYVIEFNHEVMERKSLLIEKSNELSALFASEPLEKLKTLKFVFEGKGKKSKQQVKSKEVTGSTVPTEIIENASKVEKQPIEVETQKYASVTAKNANIAANAKENNDLMSLAMELTGN